MTKETKQKIKDFCTFAPYIWRDGWGSVKSFFRPRQMWVMNNIPNTWIDKDTVMETVLFNCIIHFMENEKALDSVVWSLEDENHLKEIHYWAKYGRADKLKELDAAYPPLSEALPEVFGDGEKRKQLSIKESEQKYQKLYGKVDELEKYIYDKDTECMVWLVQNRGTLWT